MNFDVATCPTGRELSIPASRTSIGNSLRELNLEDVEPADGAAPERPRAGRVRTFDGLVVRDHGLERDDETGSRSKRASTPSRRRAADGRRRRPRRPRAPPLAGRPSPSGRGGAHQRARRRLALQDRGLPVRPDDAAHGGPCSKPVG